MKHQEGQGTQNKRVTSDLKKNKTELSGIRVILMVLFRVLEMVKTGMKDLRIKCKMTIQCPVMKKIKVH